MFDRTNVVNTPTEKSFKLWLNEAKIGDNALYYIGDANGGCLQKGAAARGSMAGELFLFRLRNVSDPTKFDYFARRLSPQAGKVLKMGEYA